MVLILGPLGLLAYWLSARRPVVSDWQQALGQTTLNVTGNMSSLILLLVFYYFFLRDGNTGLLVYLAPFAAGWLLLRAPLLASRLQIGYGRALRRAFLPELVSTNLALAGMAPRCTGMCAAWATIRPAPSKRAQEKSSRSLMLGE